MGIAQLKPEVSRRGVILKKAEVSLSAGSIKVSVFGSSNPFRRLARKNPVQYSVLVENGSPNKTKISGDKTSIIAQIRDEPQAKIFPVVCGILQISLALRDSSFPSHDSEIASRIMEKC